MTPINVSFQFTSLAAAATFMASVATLSGATPVLSLAATPTPPAPAPVPAAPPAPSRYFFDPSHNNAYEVKPGEVVPSIPTAVEIDAAKFAQIKQSLALLGNTAVSSASPAATPAAPAAGGAGLDDMFGGSAATPGATPMTADQFAAALKAKVDPAANPTGRAKLAAYFQKKGVTQISQLTAGKSDAELGALFLEAAAAVA